MHVFFFLDALNQLFSCLSLPGSKILFATISPNYPQHFFFLVLEDHWVNNSKFSGFLFKCTIFKIFWNILKTKHSPWHVVGVLGHRSVDTCWGIIWATDYFFSYKIAFFSSVQFSSVTYSCPTLRPHESQHARPLCPSPTPGVHSNLCLSSRWCIQPFHPLSSPSPPALNPSQHQGLFQWVNSSHQVANVLEFQL